MVCNNIYSLSKSHYVGSGVRQIGQVSESGSVGRRGQTGETGGFSF